MREQTELAAIAPRIRGVLCDIDGTLTDDGKLRDEAYTALWNLHRAGVRVVPVTGRPGGWADQIARFWPVEGIVAENGGLWMWHHGGTMFRRFLQDAPTRAANRERLTTLADELLQAFPGTALASDQPYRELDLAIDFCEDVDDLGLGVASSIAERFRETGAVAKVSHIHVNGWFGDFDKLIGCRRFVQDRFAEELDDHLDEWVYVGDSANDEPMFRHFPHSVGVANVRAFLPHMTHHPRFIMEGSGGRGFAELADILLNER